MKNKKIVTIGGGTGSFVVLSGLKRYPFDISAIVSMADDGGSTGILRDELGVLPPGDIRQCLVALSESSDIVRTLMGYRFENGTLKGHTFGNLFLSALEKISGSFSTGVEEASAILNVKGSVIPVTQDNIKLYITLVDGRVLKGENEVSVCTDIQKTGIQKITLEPRAHAHPKAIKAIMNADIVVIGPGNHYSSIVPNLLVKDISQAIQNTKAKVVYVCNLVNKGGQTEKFTLDDYAAAIEAYIGKERLNFVIYNVQQPPRKLIKKYENKRELLVTFHEKAYKKRSYQVIEARLLSKKAITYNKTDAIAAQRSFIRHDGEKLARIFMMLSDYKSYNKLIKRII
ncbi:MAG: gluconeogenesis factor YvcK family protein [bacterium]